MSTIKHLITVGLVFSANGFDKAASDAAYQTARDEFVREKTEATESIANDLTMFLLENPSLRNLAMGDIVNSIHERRIEAAISGEGPYAGKLSFEEKRAAREKLSEVLPEYIKENPEMFLQTKRLGVAFRFVPGENVKKDGEEVLENGETVQAYRWSDEDWNKMVTSVSNAEAKAAEKQAAVA